MEIATMENNRRNFLLNCARFLRIIRKKGAKGGLDLSQHERSVDTVHTEVLGERVTYELLISAYRGETTEYGIRVSGLGDTSEHRCVFTDKKEAQKFLELLCRGKVTPITVTDILTDYLDERDFILRLPFSDIND